MGVYNPALGRSGAECGVTQSMNFSVYSDVDVYEVGCGLPVHVLYMWPSCT